MTTSRSLSTSGLRERTTSAPLYCAVCNRLAEFQSAIANMDSASAGKCERGHLASGGGVGEKGKGVIGRDSRLLQ